MMTTTLSKAKPLPSNAYTLDLLRDEVQELVDQGIVDRQQPLYTLCRYIPGREWECFEIELADNEFLLRERIIDLLSQGTWRND